MLIQYYLADGQEIRYDTNGCSIDLYAIDYMATQYAEKRPTDLPTHVFMHVAMYTDFIKMIQSRVNIVPVGQTCVQILTSCGPLTLVPLPMAHDKFVILVGKQEDYDRYFLDQVFEETVLADCERE